MRIFTIVAAGLAALFALPLAAHAQDVRVSAVPETPLIEQSALGQALNFDFRVQNPSASVLRLRAIQLSVHDPDGALVSIYEINDNGIAPGIDTIPQRAIPPRGALTIYNPYHSFPRDQALGRLDFRFTFARDEGPDVETTISVTPEPYRTQTRLRLPLDGRVLVWDGHDFYSHHRRFDLDHPFVVELGVNANTARYSYDFVVVDAQGRLFRTDGEALEDYYSYGAPVRATGDGVVVAAHGDAPEGVECCALEALRENNLALFGNYVVIDHGNGEFSHIGHLKPGTLAVQVGQRVRMGDIVGEAGASGSSLFPHVHYELARGIDFNSEGLPSTFVNLDRLTGNDRERMRISPDSGDLIATRGTRLD